MAKNDKETVKDVLANIDLNNEEILRLEKELEEHNTSEESLEVKEEVFDIDEEDDDNDKNIPSDFVSTHCGDVFNREVLLVKHQVEVHKNSLKIFDICGKSCDNHRALYHHKRIHKKLECDICLKLIPFKNFKRHRGICRPKVDQEPPEIFKCLLCDFSSDLESCLTKHIKKEHQKPIKHQCHWVTDGIPCDYSTTNNSNLNRHISAVHIAVKWNCDSCRRVFSTSEAHDRHKRNVHQQVKSGSGSGSVLFHTLEAPREDR